ncbi:hypothetical protein COO60DRAFT_996093 [Scenedesmus sp. NREL 46B-D3]|nr:hypothetical protein COO60DRAFT_996093 [Scenedesmus sp. NREL 46B-D3]
MRGSNSMHLGTMISRPWTVGAHHATSGLITHQMGQATNQTKEQQQAAAAAAQLAAAAPEEKKKSNIVTNWSQAAGHNPSLAAGQGSMPKAAVAAEAEAGTSGAARHSAPAPPGAAAGTSASAAADVASRHAAAAAAAAAGAVRPPVRKSLGVGTRKSFGVGARRVCSAKDGSRTEPPVTRSMSRLAVQLCSPVPEGKALSGGRRCGMLRRRSASMRQSSFHPRVLAADEVAGCMRQALS